MTDLSFTIPEPMLRWLEQRAAQGDYVDVGDYLRDLVRREQRAEAENAAWVREMIAEGEASGFLEEDARDVLKGIMARIRMPEIRITRRAASDLRSIQEHGLTAFRAVRTREYMAGFAEIFARLATYPLLGASMPEYGRAVRSCLHRPYRVLYRYEGRVVSILRVAHTAQRARPIDDNQSHDQQPQPHP
ncbi:MAG: type II toxin-antitoxin system RelE/ParE family toxin [Sphingomonadaceae bacterium]